MRYPILFLLFVFILTPATAQLQPGQPATGYGGSQYAHAGVREVSAGMAADGYWLFLPEEPIPVTAPVVVFLHGYGALNPVCYGGWIRHLVRRGNIVIFPRYQLNLLTPPAQYTSNAATAIHRALDTLQRLSGEARADTTRFALIGHSYGGVITANLAHDYRQYNLPTPLAALPCAPGVGTAPTGRIASYAGMDSALKLDLIVEQDDAVVGATLAAEIFTAAISIPEAHRNLITHHPDNYGLPPIMAQHGECIAIDTAFDSGDTNYIINASVQYGITDATDYFCYWKIADALLDCAFTGNGCTTAFGDTPQQRSMGNWSDYRPVAELTVQPAHTGAVEFASAARAGIAIYPNPFQAGIALRRYGVPFFGHVDVYDALGVPVMSVDTHGEFNSASLPSGSYTIRISGGGENWWMRGVKE